MSRKSASLVLTRMGMPLISMLRCRQSTGLISACKEPPVDPDPPCELPLLRERPRKNDAPEQQRRASKAAGFWPTPGSARPALRKRLCPIIGNWKREDRDSPFRRPGGRSENPQRCRTCPRPGARTAGHQRASVRFPLFPRFRCWLAQSRGCRRERLRVTCSTRSRGGASVQTSLEPRQPARISGRALRLKSVLASGHDTLGFMWHVAWVGSILPQDKAVVTKTFSWRKAGFSYGFLWSVAVSGCSKEE